MDFEEKLNAIDQLKMKIDAYGPMDVELQKKINYKFRLEWNYNSNIMEGNSLTKQETRSVMVGNITVGGKPLKDVLEMKGHDEVVKEIIKIGQGELTLSEARIKKMHTEIMHEEDPEKKKFIGVWKPHNNYLYNYKNEKVDFVPHTEVKERMHKLVDWLNAERDKIIRKDKDAKHPVEMAFEFHLGYIIIHPFYNGNGRTARILTNLILISYGYPPLYIKLDEKERYYQYLADVLEYGGGPDLFYDFMGDMLMRSMNIILDAMLGKNIEEPDDIDKRLSLLIKELETIEPENEIKVHLSKAVFLDNYNSWIKELLISSIPMVQKFNKLFQGNNHYINIARNMGFVNFSDEEPNSIIEELNDKILKSIDRFEVHDCKVWFDVQYGTFKKGGLDTFGCNYYYEIRFDLTKYEIFFREFTGDEVPVGSPVEPIKLYERLLHKPL